MHPWLASGMGCKLPCDPHALHSLQSLLVSHLSSTPWYLLLTQLLLCCPTRATQQQQQQQMNAVLGILPLLQAP